MHTLRHVSGLCILVLFLLLPATSLLTHSSGDIIYVSESDLIRHNPSDPVYLSIADGRVVIRLGISKSLNVDSALLVLVTSSPRGIVTLPMKPHLYLLDSVFYYVAFTVSQSDSYYFIVTFTNGSRIIIYNDKGNPYFRINQSILNPQVEWVKYGVGYQIFPDRFYNGDKSNDHYGLIYDSLLYDNTTLAKPILSNWSDPPDKSMHCCHQYYGGDLKGIILKLDYLRELGVRVIYLNPIFLCGSVHCYDTYDYYQVHPRLGTLEDLKTLLDEAHRRGMRVILDFVPGHVGLGFWAFQDVIVNGPRSRYWYWFTIKRWPFTPGNGGDYRCWWGFGSLPQLNTTNPEVKKYLIEAALHWLDFGFDGLRIDTPLDLLNPREFFTELREVIKSKYPDKYIVGEIWQQMPDWVNNGPFDSLMNYPLGDFLVEYSKGGYRDNAAYVLSSYYARYSISVAGMGFNLVDSHDTSRVLTRLGGGILLPEPNPPREAVERLKLLSTLQFTLPGLPVVYMGDELGIPGLKEHMEEHRYPIQWDKLSKPYNIEVLEHYKAIGRIKNNIEALHTSIIRILESSGGLLAYTRGYYDELLVIANNGDNSAVFNLPKDLAVSNWTLVYSSSSRQPTFRGEEIVVPPITALILMKQAKPTETSVTQSPTTTSINETSIGTTLQTSTTRIEALDNYRLLIFIVVLVSAISAVVLFTKQRR